MQLGNGARFGLDLESGDFTMEDPMEVVKGDWSKKLVTLAV